VPVPAGVRRTVRDLAADCGVAVPEFED
jgi:hypothetical protein